jgi:hypothetical protein
MCKVSSTKIALAVSRRVCPNYGDFLTGRGSKI